jgi:hypothetical protein
MVASSSATLTVGAGPASSEIEVKIYYRTYWELNL